MEIVEFTDKGFYVPQADCYIDPHKKVANAITTHGHSDHVCKGCGQYIATPITAAIIRHRYRISNCETHSYGEVFEINGVQFSFHPAGHIPGSAQVRIAYQGEVWVITGDYKRDHDRVCTDFEIVPCDHFVTECTFGMPVYQWKSESQLTAEVSDWWLRNQRLGEASLLLGYSLGKAQRLMQMIESPPGPIYTHPVVDEMNDTLIAAGVQLHPSKVLDGLQPVDDVEKSLIIAPPSVLRSPWLDALGPCSIATASGWNQTKNRRRGQADQHFVISDHADWPQLIDTVEATGAEHIYVMHGFTEVFGRHLRDLGYDARTVDHRMNQSG